MCRLLDTSRSWRTVWSSTWSAAVWTKPFTNSLRIRRVFSPNPMGRLGSSPQRRSGVVSAAGAFYGANNSSFQTPSREIQAETGRRCAAKFSSPYLIALESLGVFVLSELSRCADKEGAVFPPPSPFPHWLYPLAWACSGKQTDGSLNKS